MQSFDNIAGAVCTYSPALLRPSSVLLHGIYSVRHWHRNLPLTIITICRNCLIYDVVIGDQVKVKDHHIFDYRPAEVLKIGTFFLSNDVLRSI
jgi:hypothetical protein